MGNTRGFATEIRNQVRMPTIATPFIIILEILANVVRQEISTSGVRMVTK